MPTPTEKQRAIERAERAIDEHRATIAHGLDATHKLAAVQILDADIKAEQAYDAYMRTRANVTLDDSLGQGRN